MNLFKNKIGRPSNETKRNRRFFIILVSALIVCAIGGLSFYLVNTFKNKKVNVENKNSTVYVDPEISKLYVGKQIYVDKSYVGKDNSIFVTACPSGFVLDQLLYCVSKTKNISFKYTGSFSKRASKATEKCQSYGFKGYKKYSYNVFTRKIAATCSNGNDVAPSGYLAFYYNQKEVDAGEKSACGNGNKLLKNGGCLPSSISMVFSSLGKLYKPTQVNNYVKNLNYQNHEDNYCTRDSCYSGKYQICGGSSYYIQLVNKLAADNNLVVQDVSTGSDLDKALKTGKCGGIAPLSAYCDASYCYNIRHFVAVFPAEQNGKVYVSDAADRKNILVYEDASSLMKKTQNNFVRLVCTKNVI